MSYQAMKRDKCILLSDWRQSEDYILYDPNSDNLEKTGGDSKNITGFQGLGRGRDE